MVLKQENSRHDCKVNFFSLIPVLNINGNLVQLSGAAQATTNATVTQPAVTSPATTVVPQTAIATAAAPNQLAMTNGNIVMVRNPADVRNIINPNFSCKHFSPN